MSWNNGWGNRNYNGNNNNGWGNRNYNGNNNNGWGNRNYNGNNGQSRFTKAQKSAYDSGRGYRLGQAGKAINFNNRQNYDSFMQGYKSVYVNRYPNKKGK